MTTEAREQFKKIWQKLLEELNIDCDCPGDFDGASAADSVYQTHHNERCKFRLILKEAEQAGYQAALEAAAHLLKRSRELLIQWRELNPSPASQLGTDTDSFLGELQAAIRREGR